jgi:hypothetical protein
MDYALLIASLGLQGLATYLGVKLSVDPLETLEQRRRYKIAFLVILVFGAGITIAQQVINNRSQAKLQEELKGIRSSVSNVEQQTKQPPSVVVTTTPPVVNVVSPEPLTPKPTVKRARLEVYDVAVLPVQANRPVLVNVYARNTEPVGFQLRRYGAVGFIPSPLDHEKQRDFEGQLRKLVDDAKKEKQDGHQVAGSTARGIWFTLDGPVLSEEGVRRFQAGELAIFFTGDIVYTDSAGVHTTSFCSFNQGNPKVYFQCSRFNTSN